MDHVSVSRTQGGGKLVLCITLRVELEDAAALDLVMNMLGQVARGQGLGGAS